MPLSTHTHGRARYSLECDLALPARERPAFLIKFMTDAEHARHKGLMESAAAQIRGANGNTTAYKLMRDALAVGIAGWEHLDYPPAHAEAGKPVPFDFDVLLGCGVLTEEEAWQLAWQYPAVVRPLEVDLKNSASPAPLEPAQSAAPAATGV